MRYIAAQPRSTAGLLIPSQYLCGTIFLTPYSMVWAWDVSRAMSIPFCWPICWFHFLSFYVFSFSPLFLWVGIVVLGSSVWEAVYRSLLTLLCRPYLIIIISRSTDTFSTVPPIVKSIECIVSDLETIIILVLLAINLIINLIMFHNQLREKSGNLFVKRLLEIF